MKFRIYQKFNQSNHTYPALTGLQLNGELLNCVKRSDGTWVTRAIGKYGGIILLGFTWDCERDTFYPQTLNIWTLTVDRWDKNMASTPQ